MFEATEIKKNFYVDSIAERQRGTAVSLTQMMGRNGRFYMQDAKVHDTNFAFLSTELAKLHEKTYEPKYFVTYLDDVKCNYGGGFVDYVTYFTVDWAGIMNEFRNVVGNNANYIPRVNAGLTQKSVNVFTFEVAYDLRFVELEKMKKITLQKSIQEIYQNAITAGWDLFCQKIAYTGVDGGNGGLFNNANVKKYTIDNSGASASNSGFTGMADEDVVSFLNGVFEVYLQNSNMNITLIPTRFLVPTFVGSDLSSRFSALYTSTLRQFLIDHNLGVDESNNSQKITIASRPDLNGLGTGSHGRIVAYRNEEDFVRLDVPYPMQHFITLPNIDKMSYTSAFVGQVSEIQLPYNTSDAELGPVTYWDFTK